MIIAQTQPFQLPVALGAAFANADNAANFLRTVRNELRAALPAIDAAIAAGMPESAAAFIMEPGDLGPAGTFPVEWTSDQRAEFVAARDAVIAAIPARHELAQEGAFPVPSDAVANIAAALDRLLRLYDTEVKGAPPAPRGISAVGGAGLLFVAFVGLGLGIYWLLSREA